MPGLAPVAIQQGRYAARTIAGRLEVARREPFHYFDKGNLATIGRSKAVADVKGLRLSGFPAWVTWLVVHLFFLIGFQNRLLVVLRWTISFLTHGRGARLIGERGLRSRARRGVDGRDERFELARDAHDVADDEQRRRLEPLGEPRDLVELRR